MAYTRKTVDSHEVQQKTCQGWECVCAEDTFKEARQRKKEYRENQPEFPCRIVTKRIKKEEC